MSDFDAAVRDIVATGNRLDRRGLAPATAGNYSVRLADGTLAMTVSGGHKGRLLPEQVMRVGPDGSALDGKRPSAETLLHCLIYAVDPGAGGILHTHSVPGVVLSRALGGADAIVFDGYEMLKIFPGIDTHESSVAMPLVDNSQDMVALSNVLRPILAAQDPVLPAFYIRGHGLYAWGATLAEAEYRVEGGGISAGVRMGSDEAGEGAMTTLTLYDEAAPHAVRSRSRDATEIAAMLAPARHPLRALGGGRGAFARCERW